MKIDLNKGAYIEIGGELGKYNSILIDDLIKIAKDLQELIYSLARLDLPSNDAIEIKNFTIELVGFIKGSAVPQFAYSQRTENKMGFNCQKHRKIVNESFEKLIEISNSGDYYKIGKLYPEPYKRNQIVERLFSFANDFGTAPVGFADYDEVSEKFNQIYKINRFKSSVKMGLISEIKEIGNPQIENDEAVAKVKITNKNGKITRIILNTYSDKKYSLEYATDVILTGTTKYILKFPLRCLFEKEENYFVIQSEMLDIIGTGLTENDAENAFCEEFDYIYKRINSLNDDSLTNHNKLIKSILNQIIETIEK
ncbi:MAG: hypothetical protein NTW49_14425 [Bacteroidia bacterium]|nr:hypothetical protein [Bacteroidia bacterium]